MTDNQEVWKAALIEAKDSPDDFIRGVNWFKEYMEKNALDAKIRWWGDKYYFVQSDFFDATKKQLQADEEVKVIILKQKEQ